MGDRTNVQLPNGWVFAPVDASEQAKAPGNGWVFADRGPSRILRDTDLRVFDSLGLDPSTTFTKAEFLDQPERGLFESFSVGVKGMIDLVLEAAKSGTKIAGGESEGKQLELSEEELRRQAESIVDAEGYRVGGGNLMSPFMTEAAAKSFGTTFEKLREEEILFNMEKLKRFSFGERMVDEGMRQAVEDWKVIGRGAGQLPYRTWQDLKRFYGNLPLVDSEDIVREADEAENEIRYDNYLKDAKRYQELLGRVTTIAERAGVNPEDVEKLTAGLSIAGDPANFVPGAAFAKAGSMVAKGAKMGAKVTGLSKVAQKLGTTAPRLAQLSEKIADVGAKTFQSPTGRAVSGAGRALGAVGRGTGRTLGAADAVLAKPLIRNSIAFGAGMYGFQYGVMQGLAGFGAGASFAALRPAKRIAGALTVSGDVLRGVGRYLQAPTQVGALSARNLATTKAGRAVLGAAASSRVPARALRFATARAGELFDVALRGAMIDGVLGYVATGDLSGAAEEAGGGAVIGGLGNLGRQLVVDPLARTLTGVSGTTADQRAKFVDAFESTRSGSEQALLARLSPEDRFRVAQYETIQQGALSDSRADVVSRFVDRGEFAEALVDGEHWPLPKDWTREEKITHLASHPELPRGMTLVDPESGRPLALKRVDSETTRAIFHEGAHQLMALAGKDPNFDLDGKHAQRLEARLRKKYGEDYVIEQLTPSERAERNLTVGDPLSAYREAYYESLFGEDGRFTEADRAQLYEDYYSRLGDVVPRRELVKGQGQLERPQFTRWDDLSPEERTTATMRLFEEILAEQTANLMGGIEGDLLVALERLSKGNAVVVDALGRHYLGGYLSKLQRGLESIGFEVGPGAVKVEGSDVFGDQLAGHPEELQLVADMLLAKARLYPGDTRKLKRELNYHDVAKLEGRALEEAMASGLVDLRHYQETGEVRPWDKKERLKHDAEQGAAIRKAVGALESMDLNALKPEGDTKTEMGGRYLDPEQLGALLDVDDRLLTPFQKNHLVHVNDRLMALADPDKPAPSPVRMLYYSAEKKKKGVVDAHDYLVQPFSINVNQKGNLFFTSIDWDSWTAKNSKRPLPKKLIENFNHLKELTARQLRDGTLGDNQVDQYVKAAMEGHIKSFRLDRVHAMLPTGETEGQFLPGEDSLTGSVRDGMSYPNDATRSHGPSNERIDAARRSADGRVRRAIPGGPEAGPRFRESLRGSASAHPLGASVEVKDEGFYQDPGVTLIEGDRAGAAISPEGDLVSVFKHPESPEDMDSILDEAVALGAETLDAYDINGFLPNLYLKHGFKVVARLKFNREFAPSDWPSEYLTKKFGSDEPEIVFAVRDPEGQLPEYQNYTEVRERMPIFDDWDAAVSFRETVRKALKADRP